MNDYRFHGITATDALRNTIEDIVSEIELAAPGVEVEVKVEKESKRLGHKLFCVQMTAHFWGKTILLKRQGSEVYPLLHKMKKLFIRRLHAMKQMRLDTARARKHDERVNRAETEYAEFAS